MTAIERTAYPSFVRALQPKELLTLYTPTPEDVAFVSTTAHGLKKPTQYGFAVVFRARDARSGEAVSIQMLLVFKER
jgi:hypothetical protein